jgi:hypothetical protein
VAVFGAVLADGVTLPGREVVCCFVVKVVGEFFLALSKHFALFTSQR